MQIPRKLGTTETNDRRGGEAPAVHANSEDLVSYLAVAIVHQALGSCPLPLADGPLASAQRKLDQLDTVTRLDRMAVPPGNRLEALRGDRRGQYSIRINDQYRICFVWTDEGPAEVEITDYH